MLTKNSFRLYHAVLIFIGIALWVVLAAGAIEYFRWNLAPQAVYKVGQIISLDFFLTHYAKAIKNRNS